MGNATQLEAPGADDISHKNQADDWVAFSKLNAARTLLLALPNEETMFERNAALLCKTESLSAATTCVGSMPSGSSATSRIVGSPDKRGANADLGRRLLDTALDTLRKIDDTLKTNLCKRDPSAGC